MKNNIYEHLTRIQSLGKRIYLHTAPKNEGWHNAKYIMEHYDTMTPLIQSHARSVLVQYKVCIEQINIQHDQQNLNILTNWLNHHPESTCIQPFDESDLNAFEKLSIKRKTTRNFENTQIQKTVFEKALRSSVYYPSACNRQPCKILHISKHDDKSTILSKHFGNQGISAPHLFMIVVDTSAFPHPDEQLAPSFHAGLFTQQIVLALESHDIQTCCLNWHVDKEHDKNVKLLLDLDYNMHIACLIYAGYRANRPEMNNQKISILHQLEWI